MHSTDEHIDEIFRRIFRAEAAYQTLQNEMRDLADQIRDLKEDLMEVRRAASA